MHNRPNPYMKGAILPPRRKTHAVRIGSVVVGGDNPVAVQSMTNVPTMDTQACAGQIEAIRAAGGRIVRLTAQGVREAENLRSIADEVRRRGIDDVALVADIHFRPDAALAAARYVDKVRINPGNYPDPGGSRFRELVALCRERGVALRIGVNHGSLSPRIVEKWGDTTRGMVESAMEFLETCHGEGFDQVVVSMKSSNVRVMVEAYRELVREMDARGMTYPLHLGVTEAGDGMEGRVKSAVGIGTLLAEGIGDTIRVSLTEAPSREIPVGLKLVGYFDRSRYPGLVARHPGPGIVRPEGYGRRRSNTYGNVGGGQVPVLFEEFDPEAIEAFGNGDIEILTSLGDVPMGYMWEKAATSMPGYGAVMLSKNYSESDTESFYIKAAADFGMPLLDGLTDAVRIGVLNGTPCADIVRRTALSIMQAARVRISHTEYIACPGCGRTLFDLEGTLADIRRRTSHLAGLKIGVMGCIVNGPGEMADADYGYVGEGAGKVSLYKGRQVMRRGIPQGQAVEALVELIKQEGHWREPDARP
ncbi:MAG: (E)-4-hydroxy-3-methylbut-2-enyl-diphosphate synthase [Alistipes sp.]|nr:(E)-4-hydroxy-3-methylbut-2-enyl-diphosphate synthase [Alistipes sp.]